MQACRFPISFVLAMLLAGAAEAAMLPFTITPAASGRQLVRVSLPFPPGWLQEGQAVQVRAGEEAVPASLRPLTWHPAHAGHARSVRRGLVTFPFTFAGGKPVRFTLTPAIKAPSGRVPVSVGVAEDVVAVRAPGGMRLTARLLAPARTSADPPQVETVERSPHFLWRRWTFPDPRWPRVIEVRADALGTVVLVAHLQRGDAGDGYAPALGWEIDLPRGECRLVEGDRAQVLGASELSHSFANGDPCRVETGGGRWVVYHPAAPLKRRGSLTVSRGGQAVNYRYLRCTPEDHVPLQQAAWRRAEVVISLADAAPLTAALRYPHALRVGQRVWDALYGPAPMPDLPGPLAKCLQFHHQAIVDSALVGDDWGNVTAYDWNRPHGVPFGMNRLNHCPAIFREARRTGDADLLEAALAWCDNFYDLSIWWGPDQTGGTRYNNLAAMGQTPPDSDYMWRSDTAVTFCTKGYDSFFLAYEETGDPRMLHALQAQVHYVAEHLSLTPEVRNIGDVRDFVRLYEWTGDRHYLGEALRLFRELQPKLSPEGLFSQSGDPLLPDDTFIDDDAVGYKHPFAKPYVIGYALAGLPLLAPYAPDEPRLREVVQAVADFLARSQDPLGGWRYPHPRSSHMILCQAMEHAWQLVQADRLLGPQPAHLNAIERTLRARILAWQRTGTVLGGLDGWEVATGVARNRSELYERYRRPEDRDFTRDYTEGAPGIGGASPEGLVYFPQVLAYYLEHRPASCLLAPPEPGSPLGQVLSRLPAKGKP